MTRRSSPRTCKAHSLSIPAAHRRPPQLFAVFAALLFLASAAAVPGAAACEGDLSSLASTVDFILEEGPFACYDGDPGADRAAVCGIFKATIRLAPEAGPVDAPGAVGGATDLHVLVAARAQAAANLCSAPWITFDAGGNGRGYATTFGEVAPGTYAPDGAGYGDDLIYAYNARGFVTADLVFECPAGPGQPCAGKTYATWLEPHPNAGTAWYLDTDGEGTLAAAARARAFYDWAYTNSEKPLCAHAQSSGSGRLVSVLTRFNSAQQFDSAIFEGGPVFAYAPWTCDVPDSDHPLGTPPSWYHPGGEGSFVQEIFDCAYTSGTNSDSCDYRKCRDHDFDAPRMLLDSNLTRAVERDFPALDLAAVIGGDDTGHDYEQLWLWFRGLQAAGEDVPGLTARSVTIRQGYCKTGAGTFNDGADCSLWNQRSFPGTSEAGTGYDPRLRNAGHDVAADRGGSRVLEELMAGTCGQ
ncbi:MAG: hypothetical protein HYV63_04930 [Candidatus Schekmanbacteria bacterium]|nr:hypothetical protein [Candidatus Schekmanbacteria bacterium]